MKALRVITLFSGYDSQALALNRLGIPYDLTAWCEIDRYAITAHNALFPQWKDRNLGDVSRVDWAEWHRQHPQPIDLLTYSSPCQDFSSAGLQRGGEEGSGTRSGLLWETERAVRELRPRHLVFENVGGLVSDKFIDLFNRWQARLNKYGYTNFSQLMNSKDYGVPQNRLRIFMVSILDCQRAYYFPKPFPLTRRLKGVLEQNVEERYYLKEEQVQKLMAGMKTDEAEPAVLGWTRNEKGEITDRHPVNVANCVTAAKRDNTQNYIFEPQINTLGQLSSSQNSCVIDTEGISPAVINGEKGGMPKIVEPTIIEDFYGTVREPRVYTGEAPTLRADRTGLMTIENASVAKDNLLIEPQFHDADDIPFDDGKGGTIWVKYESEEYERLMNERSEKEWEIYKQRGIQLVLGENEPSIISPGHGYFEGATNTETSPTVKCSAMQAQHFVIEPSVLAPVRTEYGKAIRKQYGDNNLPESRHNLTQLQPKQDDTSNTLTSVAKDNLLIVPQATKEGYAVVPEGGVFDASYPDSKTRRGRVQEGGTVSPTIMASQNELLRYEGTTHSVIEPSIIDTTNSCFEHGGIAEHENVCPTIRSQRTGLLANYGGIRIRRLTERELYRLMDVSEPDIDTLLAAPIPRTQHAKLAGNSIVLACLYYIFRNLFIETEPEAGTQTKLF